MSKALKIRKKNRILHVESSRLAGFLNQGYDQINDNGDVIKHATGGRTVSLPEFNKLHDAFQKLSNEKDELFLNFEEQSKEVTALKGKLTKAENALGATKEPKK